MATLLKGAAAAAALNERTAAVIEGLKAKEITPALGILRVGERPDDLSYERGAVKRCDALGIAVKKYLLPEDVSQEKLMETIKDINEDAAIPGALIFRPLPKHLDDEAVRQALLPEKDVDGITDGSLLGVFAGVPKGFPPCTAQACMEILEQAGIDPKGKEAVVVGRSLVVGRPAAMLLLQRNATVTICHTRTQDMEGVCRRAQILIVAAGRAGVIGADHVSAGQTVIDVGIHVGEDGKLRGDVDFQAAEPIVEAITPVPGGVGAVTTAVLASHVVEAASRSVRS